jgi:hypothetical protein
VADHDDDDFIDIMPAKMAGKNLPQLLVRVVKLRSAVRVQFNFDPKILEEIKGPRFDIAWSLKRRQFRIAARDLGRYEAGQTGRGNRAMLRCPIPPGFHPGEELVDPEFFVDQDARTITVEMEDHFKPRALPAPAAAPSPAAAAASHREIVERARQAVPSRLDGRGGGAADMDDNIIRTALGLNEPRALQLGEHRFTKTEAAVVELLASRDLVTKQSIMIATADPVGDDDREEKLADVLICKVRPKLEAMGFKIMTRWGDGFTIAASQRRELKAAIADARREAA